MHPFNRLFLTFSLATIVSSSFAFSLEGLSPEDAGLTIAKEVDHRDTGFVDSTASMLMILRDRKDSESRRKISNKTLETKTDGDKNISIFETPPDVKGTVSLTYSHGLQPDDQWLYLPALKRVKRINSKNKSGPFMGSEFAFEDIGSQEVEKYSYRYTGDEKANGVDCYVIERIPQYEYSGYTRQITWINKAEFRAEKIYFYDRKNSLLKTLVFTDYNKYLNQYWRAGKMLMKNHQTGKSTDLIWTNFQFRTGLTDRDFDQNSLRNTR